MSESDQGTDFEAFVLETSAVFSRVARAEAGDPHSAEDAVQVAYMRMFRSWEKIVARSGSRAAYGSLAVKDAVIDQFRRNQRMFPAPLQELPEQESWIGIPGAPSSAWCRIGKGSPRRRPCVGVRRSRCLMASGTLRRSDGRRCVIAPGACSPEAIGPNHAPLRAHGSSAAQGRACRGPGGGSRSARSRGRSTGPG